MSELLNVVQLPFIPVPIQTDAAFDEKIHLVFRVFNQIWNPLAGPIALDAKSRFNENLRIFMHDVVEIKAYTQNFCANVDNNGNVVGAKYEMLTPSSKPILC